MPIRGESCIYNRCVARIIQGKICSLQNSYIFQHVNELRTFTLIPNIEQSIPLILSNKTILESIGL